MPPTAAIAALPQPGLPRHQRVDRPQTYALPRGTLVLLSQDHPRQLVPDSRYQNGCDISRFFSCCSCSPKFSSTSRRVSRSEEHTSELQSLRHLVCRLLLEKKN